MRSPGGFRKISVIIRYCETERVERRRTLHFFQVCQPGESCKWQWCELVIAFKFHEKLITFCTQSKRNVRWNHFFALHRSFHVYRSLVLLDFLSTGSIKWIGVLRPYTFKPKFFFPSCSFQYILLVKSLCSFRIKTDNYEYLFIETVDIKWFFSPQWLGTTWKTLCLILNVLTWYDFQTWIYIFS